MLIIKETIKGKGVFTESEFCKNEIVWIFTGQILPYNTRHTLQIGNGQHINVEGLGRFINHSCEPNCYIDDKIVLYAKKDISSGEEITFDYSATEEHLSMDCVCGSPKCRQKIKGYKDVQE